MQSVIILGAGFGGLRTALLLARRGQPVTLIDKNDYHTYIPLLYEIAVTGGEIANHCDLKSIITLTLPQLIKNLPITFIKDEVRSLDIANSDIHLTNQHLHFDVLVLALGSETYYADIPGLKEHALPFKTFLDAIRIRDHLTDLPLGKKPSVVIGGGGATGIELAGEIAFASLGNVTVVQSPPDILRGFSERVIKKAKNRLTELGITLLFDRIDSVSPESVSLSHNGHLSYDVLIWTGGTKANTLLHNLPLQKEERGRIAVRSALECLPQTADLKLSSKIYALGDLICFTDPQMQKTLPGLASIALDQARVVAANILGKPAVYRVKPSPYILPIGGKYAIFSYGNMVIEGFWAWFLKGLVEFRYLTQLMPLNQALKIWLKGLKIFLENDRLG